MNKTQLQFASRKPSANRGSLGRRLSALAMSLLLVCSLPLAAFAEEYDLANGSITVTANDSGQYVTQEANNIKDEKQTTDTVIKQSGSETSSTTNTVTITAAENATANVTIQDVNIVISDPAGSPQNHGGQAAVTINVAENAEANVTLDGVSIDVGGTGGYYGSFYTGEAAVQIQGKGDVTMELDGENTIKSGFWRAGVEKNDSTSTGNLTITDENEIQGSLESTGGGHGAGIGGGQTGSSSNITITGSAEVTAKGGYYGSGIGGGNSGKGSNIIITGSAKVNAQGDMGGAGIGGGDRGSGSNITISGSAQVTATGGFGGGAGIGGGGQSTDSNNITISEDAQVKAQGGVSVVGPNSVIGEGAAIGNGGDYQYGTTDAEPYKGQEVAPITNALDEGWIATYAPGTTDLDSAIPNSLTYIAASGTVQTATADNITLKAAQPATADAHGHEAGFKVGNEVVTVTTHYYTNYVSNNDATCTKNGTENGKCSVPGCSAEHTRTVSNSKLPHEYGEYIPDANNLATCTKAGTKTATCENCTATDTVTDPAKGHSFTNYVSNNDATYEKDGTKTAKCDHPGCDASDTITDPGTRLPAPLYQLKGQDGMAVGGKTEQKDGVLTITVDADFASLTGYLGGLQGLRAQGVDTIVFVTKGATSTFALADLLASMTAGDSYALTHDGETVTFTLGNGTDISGILK